MKRAVRPKNLEYFLLTGEEQSNEVTYRGVWPPGEDVVNRFPHRFSCHWRYRAIANGLASKRVNKAQNEFEDAVDHLENKGLGVLCLCIFGNGRKDWHWYVADIERWLAAFNVCLAARPRYPLQIEHTEGDLWTYHAAFLEWAGVERA